MQRFNALSAQLLCFFSLALYRDVMRHWGRSVVTFLILFCALYPLSFSAKVLEVIRAEGLDTGVQIKTFLVFWLGFALGLMMWVLVSSLLAAFLGGLAVLFKRVFLTYPALLRAAIVAHVPPLIITRVLTLLGDIPERQDILWFYFVGCMAVAAVYVFVAACTLPRHSPPARVAQPVAEA